MTLVTAYKRLPISFTHGQGVWVYDQQDKAYIDGFCGIAVTGLGHAHPKITASINDQASKLLHISNGFEIPQQQRLAERLTQITGMSQAFFSNSGAEANEAAIKIARLYGHNKGIEKPSIIVMENAFHGRTMATLTASAGRKGQAGFEPLLPGFIRSPFNDMAALKTIAKNQDDVVAILVEPVQGEGGIRVPDDDYLQQCRQLCDEQQWLLILDEVQTGNGRLGEYYAFQQHNIMPDILTTAKGLGNGIPIGVCLMHGPATDLLTPGKHGSTFGGNPLATHVANTVLDVIAEDNLLQRAHQLSELFITTLTQALADNPHIVAIRGKGLMIGIECDQPCFEVRKLGLKHGCLLNVTAENVVRLLPPLILSDQEAKTLIERVVLSINEFYSLT